ncbi:MAG: aromatic amino acid lyase [Myxococcota bacterium]|nr:aromatic amino acid lyase [Myxococcota bacterium]
MPPKEGLTLLNGTQHMTAICGLTVLDGEATCRIADLAGALSLEALKGTARAFDPRVIAARPHPGQIAVATFWFTLTEAPPTTTHGCIRREWGRGSIDPRRSIATARSLVSDARRWRCIARRRPLINRSARIIYGTLLYRCTNRIPTPVET